MEEEKKKSARGKANEVENRANTQRVTKFGRRERFGERIIEKKKTE